MPRKIRKKQPTFEERYKACEMTEDKAEQAKCLFQLLLDITKLQDNIQLAIPNINNSIRLSMGLVNDANAIILGVARNKGNMESIINERYVDDKINSIIKSFNSMVHDLNLTKEEKFEKKILCKSVEERDRPSPDREEQKKYIFKDQV